MALFCSGFIDAFHGMAATHLISSTAENTSFIPFTWAISRLFNATILIVGVGLFFFQTPKATANSNQKQFLGFTFFFFIFISYAIIHYCATSLSLPLTMFPDSTITRPYDFVPLVLFIFCGTVLFPKFYKTKKSIFALTLWWSMIPATIT